MASLVDIIIIGASLGGLDAVPQVIAPLPLALPAAIVIVQHRASDYHARLAHLLGERCGREVVEPTHGQAIESGHVYLAPSDYHLLIEPGSFALSTEGPVSFARPSIDATMDSAADSYGSRAAAVVLTGASSDGARGAAAIATRGGPVLIQDPAGAQSPVAPRAVAGAVRAVSTGSLRMLSEQLARICGVRP